VPEGEISIDDPRAEDVRKLLERHLAFANSHSLPEDVHALDVDGLLDPAVMFVSFRRHGELLGIGALKQLDGRHAELKCMHTAPRRAGQRDRPGGAQSSHRCRSRSRPSPGEP